MLLIDLRGLLGALASLLCGAIKLLLAGQKNSNQERSMLLIPRIETALAL